MSKGMQHWGRHPPSRRDILDALVQVLDVLAEALPLALEHVGQHDQERQEEFWISLCRLETETDLLAEVGRRHREEGIDRREAITDVLSEWLEDACLRKIHPTGSLHEAEE